MHCSSRGEWKIKIQDEVNLISEDSKILFRSLHFQSVLKFGSFHLGSLHFISCKLIYDVDNEICNSPGIM